MEEDEGSGQGGQGDHDHGDHAFVQRADLQIPPRVVLSLYGQEVLLGRWQKMGKEAEEPEEEADDELDEALEEGPDGQDHSARLLAMGYGEGQRHCDDGHAYQDHPQHARSSTLPALAVHQAEEGDHSRREGWPGQGDSLPVEGEVDEAEDEDGQAQVEEAQRMTVVHAIDAQPEGQEGEKDVDDDSDGPFDHVHIMSEHENRDACHRHKDEIDRDQPASSAHPAHNLRLDEAHQRGEDEERQRMQGHSGRACDHVVQRHDNQGQ